MEKIIGITTNCLFAIIGIIILCGIFYKVITIFYSKEKTVKATLIDKQFYEKRIASKSQAPHSKKEYVLTFLCDNKKKHFNVSELSYRNYKVNQRGTLKYKGHKIIDFN